MRPGLLVTLASVALATGFCACGTLGKHYDEDVTAPEPVSPIEVVSGHISVESKPNGAMISVNGSQVGPSPTNVPIDLDASGAFLDRVEISVDFSVIAPIRGTASVVTARYKRGDVVPKLIVLARPADGGIQSLGSVLSKK